ncbi:hypothetical protein [Catellatospora tritici]|uniref:hypothetical protein n=1 Tax=Catellatospora tritici TaxID=2851566 RepID=UPI001C2D65A0|nr:hypothetical protein [Catellatospora tritici]
MFGIVGVIIQVYQLVSDRRKNHSTPQGPLPVQHAQDRPLFTPSAAEPAPPARSGYRQPPPTQHVPVNQPPPTAPESLPKTTAWTVLGAVILGLLMFSSFGWIVNYDGFVQDFGAGRALSELRSMAAMLSIVVILSGVRATRRLLRDRAAGGTTTWLRYYAWFLATATTAVALVSVHFQTIFGL